MALTEEARKMRNAYRREWYKTHKDIVKAQQERYWQRKAEKMRKETEEEENEICKEQGI